MKLFKSKETVKIGNDNPEARILVLGGGCAKCNQIESNIKIVLATRNVQEPVGHIREMADIAAYGVMSTPALVVNKKVVSTGKVLSVKELEELI